MTVLRVLATAAVFAYVLMGVGFAAEGHPPQASWYRQLALIGALALVVLAAIWAR